MSGFERNGYELFENYGMLSTEELEEILRNDILSPNSTLSTDEILYITEVMAERNKKEQRYDIPDSSESWKRFTDKYIPGSTEEATKPAEPRSEKPSRTSPKRRKKYLRILITAAVIAVLAIALSVSTFAFRDLWDTIVEWTSEKLSFINNDQDHIAKNNPDIVEKYGTTPDGDLQTILYSLGIDTPLAPTYIPKGFELSQLDITHKSDGTFVYAKYYNGDMVLTFNLQGTLNGAPSTAEIDTSDMDKHVVGYIDHYINSNNGQVKAAWTNGPYYAEIFGDITEKELIYMIDSIYER